jgi:hypothetical protein
MATYEGSSIDVARTMHHGWIDDVYSTKKPQPGHLHVFEEKKPGTLECASVRCDGEDDASGRVVVFQLRNGIDALIIVPAAARLVSLSFRVEKCNRADVFISRGMDATNPGTFSYAGMVSLHAKASTPSYTFESPIPALSCTVTRSMASMLRFQALSGDGEIGSFQMQRSRLELSTRGAMQNIEALLLLGIAFSIWKLIPSEEGASTRSRHPCW